MFDKEFDKDLFLSLCEKYDVKFSDTANEPIICEHDKKLVQHIKMDMPGFTKQGLYCYDEASFEANQAIKNHWKNYISMRISRI